MSGSTDASPCSHDYELQCPRHSTPPPPLGPIAPPQAMGSATRDRIIRAIIAAHPGVPQSIPKDQLRHSSSCCAPAPRSGSCSAAAPYAITGSPRVEQWWYHHLHQRPSVAGCKASPFSCPHLLRAPLSLVGTSRNLVPPLRPSSSCGSRAASIVSLRHRLPDYRRAAPCFSLNMARRAKAHPRDFQPAGKLAWVIPALPVLRPTGTRPPDVYSPRDIIIDPTHAANRVCVPSWKCGDLTSWGTSDHDLPHHAHLRAAHHNLGTGIISA